MSKEDEYILKNYDYNTDKYGDYHAFNRVTHKHVHGDFGLKIINVVKKYDKTNLEKRFVNNNIDNWRKGGSKAVHLLLKKVKDHSQLSKLLVNFKYYAKFSAGHKKDGIDFYSPLYKIRITKRQIHDKWNIGHTTTTKFYNILRNYNLALFYHGMIIFSPILWYKGSKSSVERAYNHYKKIMAEQLKAKRLYKNKCNS